MQAAFQLVEEKIAMCKYVQQSFASGEADREEVANTFSDVVGALKSAATVAGVNEIGGYTDVDSDTIAKLRTFNIEVKMLKQSTVELLQSTTE